MNPQEEVKVERFHGVAMVTIGILIMFLGLWFAPIKFRGITVGLGYFLILLLLLAVVIITHELIHYVVACIYRIDVEIKFSKLLVGLILVYYSGISRNQYIIIALTPIIVLTPLLLLAFLVSSGALSIILYAATLISLASSSTDIYFTIYSLTLSKNAVYHLLFNAKGDVIGGIVEDNNRLKILLLY